MNTELQIRPATAADLEAINAIYNHYVLHSTCTYQLRPETAAERQAWFDRHGAEHPITVAVGRGAIVGWGSLSPFHPREAYRQTVEDSVYLHPEWRGQGLGTALLADLITRAKALGHHAIIAAIDGAQPASIALHARQGFVEVGRLRAVGRKFGRWLDAVYMELLLPADAAPASAAPQ